MISKIWNWIKNLFAPKIQQDEHLEMYEGPRSDKAEKIRKKHGGKS